jgi:hypothetical protein
MFLSNPLLYMRKNRLIYRFGLVIDKHSRPFSRCCLGLLTVLLPTAEN